jgi:hypothetical protein
MDEMHELSTATIAECLRVPATAAPHTFPRAR